MVTHRAPDTFRRWRFDEPAFVVDLFIRRRHLAASLSLSFAHSICKRRTNSMFRCCCCCCCRFFLSVLGPTVWRRWPLQMSLEIKFPVRVCVLVWFLSSIACRFRSGKFRLFLLMWMGKRIKLHPYPPILKRLNESG